MQTNNVRIPGRLQTDDLTQLAELARDKTVLQLGCYCGRGLLAVAPHAQRVWVLEDFLYPGGMDAVVQELMRAVDRSIPEDKPINLLKGDARSWLVPEGAADVPLEAIDLVYRDADRTPRHKDDDDALAYELLRRRGGVYAWHDEDHKLRWLRITPVAVEVN